MELLLDRRPTEGFDWRSDDAAIREALAWPLDGLFFDLEHAGLWHAKWGPRPEALAWQKERVRELVAAAPKLIPIMSHRYISETPHEAGNPVFSVYQSDIIYYGANLADYFEREFFPEGKMFNPIDYSSIRRIEFWSFLVENFAEGLNYEG